MLELLKKIGVPATVAAVIATLVTIVPLLFTVDERYAKAEDLEKMVVKLEGQLERQNRELAQLAGFQHAMISLILQGKLPTNVSATAPAPVVAPAPSVSAPRPTAAPRPRPDPVVAAPAPAPAPAPAAAPAAAPIEKPKNWKEIDEGLLRQQQRLIRD